MVHLQPQFEAVDELLLEMVEPQIILEAVEVVQPHEKVAIQILELDVAPQAHSGQAPYVLDLDQNFVQMHLMILEAEALVEALDDALEDDVLPDVVKRKHFLQQIEFGNYY